MKGLGDVFNGDLAINLSQHRYLNPRPFNLLPLQCSLTFNTGLGLLLVPHFWALSSIRYSGGPCSDYYSHCLVGSKRPQSPYILKY